MSDQPISGAPANFAQNDEGQAVASAFTTETISSLCTLVGTLFDFGSVD